jgi:hypothetical protein
MRNNLLFGNPNFKDTWRVVVTQWVSEFVDSTLSDGRDRQRRRRKGRVPFHFTRRPSPCSDQSTKQVPPCKRTQPGRRDGLRGRTDIKFCESGSDSGLWISILGLYCHHCTPECNVFDECIISGPGGMTPCFGTFGDLSGISG